MVGPALTPGSAGLERRRDMRRYADWAPGGRNPRFGRPLLLPSLLVGRSPELGGALPAASPGEDGLFEGRAVVRLPTRSGRRLS